MTVEELKTYGLGTPKAETRTRADYIREYVTFNERVKDYFKDSATSGVISTLTDLGYETPHMALYCFSQEIINAGTFPGSPHYWHQLITWAWDMVRAYGDAAWDEQNESFIDALMMCADDIKEFIELIVQYA